MKQDAFWSLKKTTLLLIAWMAETLKFVLGLFGGIAAAIPFVNIAGVVVTMALWAFVFMISMSSAIILLILMFAFGIKLFSIEKPVQSVTALIGMFILLTPSTHYYIHAHEKSMGSAAKAPAKKPLPAITQKK